MVGITGYGIYIPFYRIKTAEIANVWGRDSNIMETGMLIDERTVPNRDEDSVTMGIESSLNAIRRAKINPKNIGAIYCGSESPAYAVKPNIGMIANAIGMDQNHTGADVQFACKAGTAAMQMVMGLVKSNMINYGIAIASDVAEINVESVVDQGGGAGSAAFIIGKEKNEVIAEIEETLSTESDMPDFWRRPHVRYPSHGERFTGEPSYFTHTITASKMLMEKASIKPSDVDHVAFHTPNKKFATKVAKILGFGKDQLKYGFVVDKIGNTFSAASLLGLASILDNAKPGEKILMTSFGGGAGSDAFYMTVTEAIEDKRNLAKTTKDYIEKKKYIDYLTYLKFTNRIE